MQVKLYHALIIKLI